MSSSAGSTTLVGRDNVVMLHLNDSRTTVLGSHLDRHEHIAAGQVGADGMRELLTHPWLATLPTFLETPGMDTGYDEVNLDRVRLADRGRDATAAAARGVRGAQFDDRGPRRRGLT